MGGRARVRSIRRRSRRRERLPRLAALAVSLGLCAAPLVGGLGGTASAQSPANELPLTLTITTLTPVAPQPRQLLTITGTLTNPTQSEYDDLTVVLRLSATPLLSRAALLAVTGDTTQLDAEDVGQPVTIDRLAPGASVPYQVEVAIADMDLVTPGVYRISLEAYQSDPNDNRIYDARINTFLPWLPPSADVAPVHIAWLWPLLSTPHLLANDTFTDDSLGVDISPRGRLGLLLGVATQAISQSGSVHTRLAPLISAIAGPDPFPQRVPIRPVPVTPVIDPETIQELQLMSSTTTPYVVRGTGTTTAAKPGAYAAVAASYLAQLQALMAKTSSIAVPYADPDIEALTGAHASALVTQARSTGLEAGLSGIATGLLWPPGGALSENALDQLTASGLVLTSGALPVIGPPPAYTPTATTTVALPGGTVPAVVIDQDLSTFVTKPIHAGAKALVIQRFAAETAAIAVEGGPAPRALVIAPARRWSSTETAIRTLLAESGQLPWLTPETVPQVLRQDRPDPTVTRGPLQEPPGGPTLPDNLAAQIAGTNAELAGFRSILCPATVTSGGSTTATKAGATAQCDRDGQTLNLQRSLYRAASTAFDQPSDGGAALLASTRTQLARSEAKVHIATKGDVVLSGKGAKIAISVVNGLPVPVKVQLVLLSKDAALQTTPAEDVTIAANGQSQHDVTVTTAKAGAGTLLVQAQLLTPGGRDFGAPTTLRVRVSAYGAVVVAISIAVGGLLVLAVIVRIYRRIQLARRGPAEDPADDPAGAPA